MHRFDRIFVNEKAKTNKPATRSPAAQQTKSNHHPYPAIAPTDKSLEIVNFTMFRFTTLVNIFEIGGGDGPKPTNTQHEHAKKERFWASSHSILSVSSHIFVCNIRSPFLFFAHIR
jgi:hypothetical protein